MSLKKDNISPMQLILGGYCIIILIGTLLLALPAATRGGESTPFSECFFTATSATCVTGMTRFDTFTHWSLFGQLVILGLVQVGGVGFMTVTILVMMLAKKKISLNQRFVMQSSVSAPQLGGIVKMTKFIAFGTLLMELVGAILLSFSFIPRFGVKKGIYFSVFHSISAFCNAGFDLTGGLAENTWYVNVIFMLLVFVGGLGFFVWQDLCVKKFRFRNLNLQSKMVLSLSAGLVLVGAILFYLLESGYGAYAEMSFGERLMTSLFQSVSVRTAGFSTVDLKKMTESGIFLLICLMFIGGATGSTAGGIKMTTFWVLCVSIFATFRRKKNIEAFGRRVDENITRTASCIFMIYLLLISAATIIIAGVERLPILTALLEATSAMTTAGMTLGVTAELGMVTKLLLAFLMLCGRVGSVTMLLAFSSEKRVTNSRLPLEQIQVG